MASEAKANSPQQPNADNWMEKAQRLEESNHALQKQVRELQAQLQAAKVTTRILENNLTASQSKCAKLERDVSAQCFLFAHLRSHCDAYIKISFWLQLQDFEADRTSLISLIADLMKRLPVGHEVVVPPDVVRCLEEYMPACDSGGISITVTGSPPTEIVGPVRFK